MSEGRAEFKGRAIKEKVFRWSSEKNKKRN